MISAALAALRQLLFDPASFFEEHPPSQSIGPAVGVVLATASVVTLGIGATVRIITAQIDATRTETVAEPWPDSRCNAFEKGHPLGTPRNCEIEEPITREVDVGAEVWEGFVGELPGLFVNVIVGWVLLAVVLHVLSAFFGGEGSFLGTLAVTGWASILDTVPVVIGIVTVFVVLLNTSFTSDPDVLAEQFQQLASPIAGGIGLLVSAIVITWQAYIWTRGLQNARRLPSEEASATAGIVAFVQFSFALLLFLALVA